MKRITTSFMVILLTFVCSLSTKAQSVEATTAWFNGETFADSTLGKTITYPGFDWSNTLPVIRTTTNTSVAALGNVLGFSPNTATVAGKST